MKKVKERLDREVENRNTLNELSDETPDPLMVVHRYKDEYIALICALFSYGNAKNIVKFLNTLDFSLLDQDESTIQQTLSTHYYRFQNANDVTQLFITLSRLQKTTTLENLFMQGYKAKNDVLSGVYAILEGMQKVNYHKSRGYQFLIGKPNTKSAYKRWMMFLRWMVRKDSLDLGLWTQVNRADLLLPLDTHTFKVGHKLGLLKRKTYDLKAVYEITQSLKAFDPLDPIKYDFALYRLGQEKLEL